MQDHGGEDDDEADADDEFRHRRHGKRGYREAGVEGPIAPDRRRDAEGDGDGHADGADDDQQAEGIGDAWGRELIDALGRYQGGAEIAGEEAGEPDPILRQRRAVEMKLEAQDLKPFRRGAAAEDGAGRIARQDLGRGEDDDGDQQQGERPEEQPAADETQQRMAQGHGAE